MEINIYLFQEIANMQVAVVEVHEFTGDIFSTYFEILLQMWTGKSKNVTMH